jgi:hypothetical protein
MISALKTFFLLENELFFRLSLRNMRPGFLAICEEQNPMSDLGSSRWHQALDTYE